MRVPGEWSDTGLLTSVQSPGERVTRLAYDERKNVSAVTLPNGARIEHEHDGQGRVVRVRDALGAITRVERCSEGVDTVRAAQAPQSHGAAAHCAPSRRAGDGERRAG